MIGRALATLAVAGALAAVVATGVPAAASPAPCPSKPLTQPFLPWADQDQYFLAPDGSVEALSSWSLSNASRASGNETYYVNSSSDRYSLSLGSYGSATTASICVTVHIPTLRLFLRNTGSSASTLKVEVLYTDTYGMARQKTVAYLSAGSSWAPSTTVAFLNYIAPLVNGQGQTWVGFRFTATGSSGSWQLDDLYVDPHKHV